MSYKSMNRFGCDACSAQELLEAELGFPPGWGCIEDKLPGSVKGVILRRDVCGNCLSIALGAINLRPGVVARELGGESPPCRP